MARRDLIVDFYNVRVGRETAVVAREIRAFLAERPHVLALVEAGTNRLPLAPGYVLLRDTSTGGRANVAAYVRSDVYTEGSVRWHDLETRWLRTEHPGVHPARAALEFRVGRVQVLVHHAPPLGIRDPRTRAFVGVQAQEEGIALLADRMTPWRRSRWSLRSAIARTRARRVPRLVVMDANRLPSRPSTEPGPAALAERIGGFVVGTEIDSAVQRHAPAKRAFYRRTVGDVLLGTDHRHGAFRVVFSVAARFLR